MTRFTQSARASTQAPLIPQTTPLLDKNAPNGVSFEWMQALQALQAQKPYNPVHISAVMTPLIVDSIHNVLFITTGPSAFTVQLGPAKSSPFSIYLIVKADAGAGAITINPSGVDSINGAPSLVQLATQWRTTVLVPDNKSNWLAFSVAGGG
jgi:hypothetical protein